MDYSFSQITTADDCDALLEAAQIEKDDLDFRKTQQDRLCKTIATGTTNVEAELMIVTGEIVSLEAYVATLPPSESKDEFENRIYKLGYKKRLLEERRERYGIIALLQKQHMINCIEKQQAETVFYIDELNKRKTEV